jgi:hypothetical protein
VKLCVGMWTRLRHRNPVENTDQGAVPVYPPFSRLANGDPYLTNKSPFSGGVSPLVNDEK